MSSTITASGSCLCGSVQINTTTLSKELGACHCGMCRKWNGGPFLTVDGGPSFKINGLESITTYDSSEWAERSFCKKCGTHLFYKLKNDNKYFVSSGLFADVDFSFDHQIFIDKKPSYYTFSNKTHNMTEAEVFAMYTSQ